MVYEGNAPAVTVCQNRPDSSLVRPFALKRESIMESEDCKARIALSQSVKRRFFAAVLRAGLVSA
jgi:hypothetical protein